MTTITVNDLALNLRKYLDYAKSEPFILNDNDESFSVLEVITTIINFFIC